MSVNSMFCFPPSKSNDEHRTVAAISPFGDATHQRRQEFRKNEFQRPVIFKKYDMLKFYGCNRTNFCYKVFFVVAFYVVLEGSVAISTSMKLNCRGGDVKYNTML